MKQLLLRVDDELHARLTAQARAQGTSVNALCSHILSLGIDPAALSRTDRLRLKLMQIGAVGRNPGTRRVEAPGRVYTAEEREAVYQAAVRETRGWDVDVDALIREQRGEL